MVNLIYIIIATIFVTIIGGGGAYLIYIQNKTKKKHGKQTFTNSGKE